MSFSYDRGEKSSFVVRLSRPYIRCMKNRDFNVPSLEELYALERAARLERSREMAKLARSAARSVIRGLRRVFEAKVPKGLRHA
jgi:hypothetical protein